MMNINASILDQQLDGIVDNIRERAAAELSVKNDETRLKSLAFVYHCVQTMLDLDPEATFDCLTEGGGDFGIDAIHISEENDGEFGVTLFQAKYKHNTDANAHFPENGINALINAISCIFDPAAVLGNINDRLRIRVEEARSMIRDGSIPQVRAIACNNGLKWNESTQAAIDRFNSGKNVTWEHINHDVLVSLKMRQKSVDATLRLVGNASFEDMKYSSVCIGRIPVAEIAALMEEHGDRLFERNIRRYLGLHGNRVNESIMETLKSKNPENFYFFNNGLTLICDDFKYNAYQKSDYHIRINNFQIVNGGQTSMTIYKTYEELKKENKTLPSEASALVRIYKLPDGDDDIALKITHATNNQNPVDLKDLKANDERQKTLEQSIESLGYEYRRKRTDSITRPIDITPGAAAEAILAVWRKKPHQAKFLTRQHFGKLYHDIFTSDLNGAHTIIAVLLYRIAENRRKRPADNDPVYVRYASCFIAMQMGKCLLQDMGISLNKLDHRNFRKAVELVNQNGQDYFSRGLEDVKNALRRRYGEEEISLQQLSAAFRRGDLLEKLN